MKYILLIHNDETVIGNLSEAERQAIVMEFRQFTQDIKTSGHLLASARLHPTTSATSVRVRDGKRLVTDGPFAETREQLGGYYVIDASNLDEAIAVAERIPSARTGTIEVRPVMDVPILSPA
jgi:hypothetical protein